MKSADTTEATRLTVKGKFSPGVGLEAKRILLVTRTGSE